MGNYTKHADVFKLEGREYPRETLEGMSYPEITDISERALFKANAIEAEIQQMEVTYKSTGLYEDPSRYKHLLYGRAIMRSWLSVLKRIRERHQNRIYQFYTLCETSLAPQLFNELLAEVDKTMERHDG